MRKEFSEMVQKCNNVLEVLGKKREDNKYFDCEDKALQFCVKTD